MKMKKEGEVLRVKGVKVGWDFLICEGISIQAESGYALKAYIVPREPYRGTRL